MKHSQEIIQEFLVLHQEFLQSHSKKAAQKLLEFMQNPANQSAAKRVATHNPHPLTHQSFERDWETTMTALISWIEGKVKFTVPGEFLEEIKIWISKDFI